MLVLSCQHLGNPACRSAHYPGSWVSAKPHTLWEIHVLTQLAHFQDLTQHLGQLYTTAAEGTFMLIFSATVLKHNLQAGKRTVQKGKSVCRKHQKCWLYYNRETDPLQTTKLGLLGAEQNCTWSIFSVKGLKTLMFSKSPKTTFNSVRGYFAHWFPLTQRCPWRVF